MRALLALSALAPLLLLAACSADEEQARLCDRVVAQIEGGVGMTVLSRRRTDGKEPAVTVRYRTGAEGPEKSVTCRFADGGFGGGPTRLIAVRRDDGTFLHRVSLGVLRARLNIQ